MSKNVLKAIGLSQPDAWLVINGYVEAAITPRSVRYKGRVFIYALSNKVDEDAYKRFLAKCRKLKIASPPKLNDFDYGGFLGWSNLVGFETDTEGRDCALFENSTELGFRKATGRAGFFNLHDSPYPTSSTSRRTSKSKPGKKRTRKATIVDIEASQRNMSEWAGKLIGSIDPQLLDGVQKAGKDLLDGCQKQIERELQNAGRRVIAQAVRMGQGWFAEITTGRKSRRR